MIARCGCRRVISKVKGLNKELNGWPVEGIFVKISAPHVVIREN